MGRYGSLHGSTIVAVTQVGRFSAGSASNVGWATSTDNGATWKNGFLPDTTTYSTPAGPYDRVSDPRHCPTGWWRIRTFFPLA